MSTGPAVAKTVWTDADFEEGILPEAPAAALSFWICPATLVFDRAWDLTTDINLQGWSFQLFLDAIERSGPTSAASPSGPSPATTSASANPRPACQSAGPPRRLSPLDREGH